MKKILYTLFSLFVLASCTHDELDIPAPLQQESGEKVKLTFNVNIPEAQSVETRAFGESATLKTLWLVLFDEFGYYVGKAQAYKDGDKTSGEISGVNMTTTTQFYVELNVTQSPRIIHFIGNYDLAGATLAGHENAIISRLNVTGGQDAYWQRIDVAEIAKEDGAVADETTGLFVGKLPTEMDPVHLLRNFAKITVTNEATAEEFSYTDYTEGGFDIITTESHGSVAPYNVATDQASFPTFISSGISSGNTCVSYQDLLKAGYTGFIPGASTHQNTFDKESGKFPENQEPSFSKEAQYLYERNNADGQTYVIVKGKWNGAVTYYKIDLIREVEGSAVTYFHILRNFHYKIVIRSVEGAGAKTPEEAAAGAASNNIFASVELQHLTNIGDGEARLFVNYTSKTLISNAPVTLEFNFLNESGEAANGRIALQEGNEAEVFASIAGPYHVGDDNYDASLVENTGYSYYVITPKAPGTLPLDESLTLYDKGIKNSNNEYTTQPTGLQRKVEYTLRNSYKLALSCTETVGDKIGQPLEVSLHIENGLPSYLFPLTFFIESSKLSIYPDIMMNSMPVNTRTTIVDNSGKNSFGYDRVITYEEYAGLSTIPDPDDASKTLKVAPCHFLTNMPASASTVYAENELFNKASDSFNNILNLKEFTNLSLSSQYADYYGVNQDVTFTYHMEDASSVNVKMSNLVNSNNNSTAYTYNADGGDESISLTTSSFGGNRTVRLSADGYYTTDITISPRYLVIPAGRVKTTSSQAIYISTSNAETTADGDRIRFNNGSNNELTLDRTGLTENTPLYFKYEYWYTIYIAGPYTVSEILAGINDNLSFSEL